MFKKGNRKLSRRKVVVLLFVVPLVMLLASGAVYAKSLLKTTEKVLESSYKEIDRSKPVEEVNPIEEPVSILLMGIDDDDERGLGSARADSLIYATVNPKTHQLDMVSIPRDTYVPIMNDGEEVGMDRINTAYAIGEEDAMVETVEHFLDLPVNYYATFNFHSFLDVIDALGGIEVDVPVDIVEMDSKDNSQAISLNKGLQTLNGEQALALARTRKIDDDIARGQRQQLVVKSVINKAADLGSITKYNDVLKSIGANMRTNMKMNEIKSVLQTGLNESFDTESHVFGWTSFRDAGRDLVKIDSKSYDEIQQTLAESLELEQQTINTIPDGIESEEVMGDSEGEDNYSEDYPKMDLEKSNGSTSVKSQ
ncbi:LCP family protein [Marinilactibacillus kalidii]|uniref:LCP family protein n=1 Tax=Marinilactibacillus kalidii TaxID=2820274 RepID=UPI001ABEB254|nr:LCP family protein [Marinilactibacillus kalidii]